jgi:ribosomal protein S18
MPQSKIGSQKQKRHFTAVVDNEEQGLYNSYNPSSAAKKAVSKLCADDKKRQVEFYVRETTQGSNKKTYGPYLGFVKKLKEPIELEGRVIKYSPVAKLSKNVGEEGKLSSKKLNGGSKKHSQKVSKKTPKKSSKKTSKKRSNKSSK